MIDWELWACANRMRSQHGDDAAFHAATRADALLEAGDAKGRLVWTAIIKYIEKLEDPAGDGVTRH